MKTQFKKDQTTFDNKSVVEDIVDAQESPTYVYLGPDQGYTAKQLELVFASVPKAFQLTLNSHVMVKVKAGAQKMERFVAEHWYSKANEVTIVE